MGGSAYAPIPSCRAPIARRARGAAGKRPSPEKGSAAADEEFALLRWIKSGRNCRRLIRGFRGSPSLSTMAPPPPRLSSGGCARSSGSVRTPTSGSGAPPRLSSGANPTLGRATVASPRDEQVANLQREVKQLRAQLAHLVTVGEGESSVTNAAAPSASLNAQLAHKQRQVRDTIRMTLTPADLSSPITL